MLQRTLIMFGLILAGEAIFALPFHVTRFFRPTVLEVFGLTATELGAAQSWYGLVAILCYFLGGPLADRYSVRPLLAISLWSTALGGLYLATFPDYTGALLIWSFFGVSTILLFWAALIKATRNWGQADTQGRAFGLMEGGRGLLAALLASIGGLIFGLAFPDNYEATSMADREAALHTVIYLYVTVTALSGLFIWLVIPDTAPASPTEDASGTIHARASSAGGTGDSAHAGASSASGTGNSVHAKASSAGGTGNSVHAKAKSAGGTGDSVHAKASSAGITVSVHQINTTTMAAPMPACQSSAHTASPQPSMLHHTLAVMRLPAVWLQALIVLCAYVAYKGFDNYSLFAVQVYGLNEVEAADMMTLSAWLRPLAALGAGLIADRWFGAGKILFVCFGVLLLAELFFALTEPATLADSSVPLTGAAAGLTIPVALYGILLTNILITVTAFCAMRGLYYAIMQQARIPLAATGTAAGLVSAIGFTPDVFVAYTAGLLIDRTPGVAGHQHFFLFLAAFAALGTVCSFAMLRLLAANSTLKCNFSDRPANT